MRIRLCLLLVVIIFLFSSCALPLKKDISDVVNDNTQPSTNLDKTENNNEIPEPKSPERIESQPVTDKDMLQITLYYQDGEGYIIPVSRKVAKQEGIAKMAVRGITDNTLNREEIEYYGLYPVLPQGTEILGMNIKNGNAVIDFNDKLLNYEDEISERNIVSSIVYTLTEFSTIESVQILINGRTQGKLKYNTDIAGNLSRKNVLVNSKKANLTQGMDKLDIYLSKYINDKYIYMLPISIEDSTIPGDQIPTNIIDSLSKKFDIKGVYSEIPAGTRLLDSSLNEGILTLDFSSELKSYGGGTAREDTILKQILYSVKQIEDVTGVKMLIDGDTAALPEGTDISKVISVPKDINNIIN